MAAPCQHTASGLGGGRPVQVQVVVHDRRRLDRGHLPRSDLLGELRGLLARLAAAEPADAR
jgi:hypothetical protein